MANPYFNAIYYFSKNPDLAVAGLKLEDAETHYANYGAAEALLGATSRAPNAWFDIQHYYSSNPDLIAAVNAGHLTVAGLFEHFTTYGAVELRSPSASVVITNAELSAYAAANKDLRDAFGITDTANLTAEQKASLVQQFYAHGINEDRPAKPADLPKPDDGSAGKTFTLTDKIGEIITGTDGNDTISAVIGGTGATSVATLNLGDVIDGGAGKDTLTLTVGSAATAIPGGVSIKNVEIVRIDSTAATVASAFLNSSSYEGVQELWQQGSSGATFGDVTVANGVTAGFKGGPAFTADVNAAATQKAVSVALDGVTTASQVNVVGAAVETVTVNGSVGGAGVITLASPGTAVTFNGGFTSNVNATLNGTALKTVDLSKSTGNVTVNATALTGTLETIKGGSGNDSITVDLGTALATIDLGAGNDVLTLADAAASNGKDAGVSITLGAGKDTIVTNAAKNVKDLTDLTKGLVTVTDFVLGEDAVQLSAAGSLGTTGVSLTSGQLAAAKELGNLKAALDYVAGQIGASKSAVFSFGSDAYVLVNDATAAFGAGDGLIKITGLDAAQLSVDQNGGLVL